MIIIGVVCIFLYFVLLSDQLVSDEVSNFVCPLEDNPKTVNGKLVHNLTRTASCLNGRKMAGCCVQRMYCDYNTSHIDLTLYGPPGFHMPCLLCCPQKYILPIPLPNSTEDDDSSSSMDDSDNIVDSDSDED